MTQTSYYSLRRLCPFRGTIQVVELVDAHASSVNGVDWRLALRSPEPVSPPAWGNLSVAAPERRFFSYGSWSRVGGVKRWPVNPLFDDPSRHPALPDLLGALEQMPALPFPPGDTAELWLLDAEGAQPLAVLESRRPGTTEPAPNTPSWAPERGPISAPGFGSCPPELPELAACPSQAAELQRRVGTLVGRACGHPARAQWFERQAGGGGIGGGGTGIEPAWRGRSLDEQAFPELLLREEWPDRADRLLVSRYLAWQAPWLLTLAHLSPPRRAQLEALAVHRPELLLDLRRLIPSILNPELVDVALVQAVLRRAG